MVAVMTVTLQYVRNSDERTYAKVMVEVVMVVVVMVIGYRRMTYYIVGEAGMVLW